MTWEKAASPSMSDRGMRVALIFALAAERLTAFYEHSQWMTEAQGASLAADWLARAKNKLPLNERRQLSALSDQLARQIEATLSRDVHRPRNDGIARPQPSFRNCRVANGGMRAAAGQRARRAKRESTGLALANRVKFVLMPNAKPSQTTGP